MHLKNVVHLVHNPCAKSFIIARLTYSIHFGTDYDNCSVETNYDSISLPCERKTPAKPLDLDIKAVTGMISVFLNLFQFHSESFLPRSLQQNPATALWL